MSTNKDFVKDIVTQNGNSRERLLPILQDIVKEKHYLTEDTIVSLSNIMDISPADIYGVATFYSFLDVQPRGKNVIRICKTIACDVAGKDAIISSIEDKLRIKIGETTPDNKFTLLTTNCIGWCHQGPAMLINDQVYTNLTAEIAVDAINEYL